IGDTVSIRGSRYPVELRCRLVGYLTAEILSDYFAIHRSYLEEALGPDREPGVHFFPLKVESREALPRVIGQIDAHCANAGAAACWEAPPAMRCSHPAGSSWAPGPPDTSRCSRSPWRTGWPCRCSSAWPPAPFRPFTRRG